MTTLRKKVSFVIAAAAVVTGSLALAAPSVNAYPTHIPCDKAHANWTSYDGPGYSGQGWVCTYNDREGWHWQRT
ncbi:hypothetical protein [Nocardia asiatica]|uniref:hypothetical protein n=1 Tax=Nocardia asiatica TaxID=209252 RepID=UPI0024548927|nr:hypothetical protein [Nocardia asiatica]